MTPQQKIRASAKLRQGLWLTKGEVQALAMDPLLNASAEHDDLADKAHAELYQRPVNRRPHYSSNPDD